MMGKVSSVIHGTAHLAGGTRLQRNALAAALG
jgi:hypothetical protein